MALHALVGVFFAPDSPPEKDSIDVIELFIEQGAEKNYNWQHQKLDILVHSISL